MKTSIYIHWPFCESKCPYCDFNSHVREKVEFERWLGCYLKEIVFWKNKLGKIEIDSIFFGGGTPSLMRPEMIEEILARIKREFIVGDGIEVTLEANPSSFEVEKFKSFKQAGINRVSIGVQSFDEASLKFLGRKHDKAQAINAIEQAGKIFGNFSFDLIYSRPNQNIKNWGEELDFALKFNSPHISLYQLTIEKGTPFYSDFSNKKFTLPEEELASDLYNLTVEKCAGAGLERYEVSNFAKPGFESRHNLNYWLYNDYIGIGPGAHGRRLEGDKRLAWFDVHQPENWLEAVEKRGEGIQQQEFLGQKEMLEEMLFMGLRIKRGIERAKFKRIFGKDFVEMFDAGLVKKMCAEGLMVIDDETVKLSDVGILLHTSVVRKLASSIN